MHGGHCKEYEKVSGTLCWPHHADMHSEGIFLVNNPTTCGCSTAMYYCVVRDLLMNVANVDP